MMYHSKDPYWADIVEFDYFDDMLSMMTNIYQQTNFQSSILNNEWPSTRTVLVRKRIYLVKFFRILRHVNSTT